MTSFTWKAVLGTIAVGVAILVLTDLATNAINTWRARRAAAAATATTAA